MRVKKIGLDLSIMWLLNCNSYQGSGNVFRGAKLKGWVIGSKTPQVFYSTSSSKSNLGGMAIDPKEMSCVLETTVISTTATAKLGAFELIRIKLRKGTHARVYPLPEPRARNPPLPGLTCKDFFYPD